jgi:hypothetical protein
MIKKIAIKRIRIKIEIQNKFYIWLKGKIEKKNNLNKRKKIKIMRTKFVKIICHKFKLKYEIENK